MLGADSLVFVGGIQYSACLPLFTYFDGNGSGRSRARIYGAAAACPCYAATEEEMRTVRQFAAVQCIV